jgi:hypothetical protein
VAFRGKIGKFKDYPIVQITVSLVNNKYYASIIFKKVIISSKPKTEKVLGLD